MWVGSVVVILITRSTASGLRISAVVQLVAACAYHYCWSCGRD